MNKFPPGAGPCVKQTVTATIVSVDGYRFVGTNHCLSPQISCPRAGMATGQGYELCRDICNQPAHAEVNAVALAGDKARGATLYLEGHTYACEPCKSTAERTGIKEIVIGPPSCSITATSPIPHPSQMADLTDLIPIAWQVPA